VQEAIGSFVSCKTEKDLVGEDQVNKKGQRGNKGTVAVVVKVTVTRR